MKKEIYFVSVFILGLILLLVFQLDWFNKNSGALIVFFTGIYAALTYLIVQSNQKILQETSRPYVLVSFILKPVYEINLSIKNFGKRPARDVRVEIDPPIHTLGEGFYEEAWSAPLMKQPFMPPDFEVSNLIGVTFEVLRANTTIPPIKVKIKYTDLERKNSYREEYEINLASYLFKKKVVDKNEQDFLESISKSLEKIEKHVSKRK
jgi:hypothetical protein